MTDLEIQKWKKEAQTDAAEFDRTAHYYEICLNEKLLTLISAYERQQAQLRFAKSVLEEINHQAHAHSDDSLSSAWLQNETSKGLKEIEALEKGTK